MTQCVEEAKALDEAFCNVQYDSRERVCDLNDVGGDSNERRRTKQALPVLIGSQPLIGFSDCIVYSGEANRGSGN